MADKFSADWAQKYYGGSSGERCTPCFLSFCSSALEINKILLLLPVCFRALKPHLSLSISSSYRQCVMSAPSSLLHTRFLLSSPLLPLSSLLLPLYSLLLPAVASYEALAKDYWDAVETGAKEPLVEYGSDLDTLRYCSGFSKKLPNSSGIEGAEYKTVKQESVKQETVKIEAVAGDGHTDMTGDEKKETVGEAGEHSSDKNKNGMFSDSYYERTGWNLNNLAASEGSVLKYLQVRGPYIPYSIYFYECFVNLIRMKFRMKSNAKEKMILMYCIAHNHLRRLTITIKKILHTLLCNPTDTY
jgi:hypothetical protein